MKEKELTMYLCNLCARNCNVDRSKSLGYCGMPEDIYVARAALHPWEEPCISGIRGSGTVFFSGCSLRCVFCQNYSISMKMAGKKMSVEDLADTFLRLESEGAHNINLVTPTHYVRQVISALDMAKGRGLSVPVVYNTGTYENVSTIKMLDGYVDIYLPDMKYLNRDIAKKYSNAYNYPDVAKEAIREMVRQVGKATFFDDGMMKKGVIVRHLVLPGNIYDSKDIIDYLYDTYGDDIFVSIMNQYTPLSRVKNLKPLDRKLSDEEYEEVVDYALFVGVKNGFIQEGNTAKESFIPDFDQ